MFRGTHPVRKSVFVEKALCEGFIIGQVYEPVKQAEINTTKRRSDPAVAVWYNEWVPGHPGTHRLGSGILGRWSRAETGEQRYNDVGDVKSVYWPEGLEYTECRYFPAWLVFRVV